MHQYISGEIKLITEKEFEISNETGQTVKAKPGDVFYFPRSTKATYTTQSYGVGFYVCSFQSMQTRLMLTLKAIHRARKE